MPRKGKSRKAKKKLRPDVKKSKCESTDAKKTAAVPKGDASQPWIYSKLKAEYVESMVTSAGVSRSEACEAWNQSSQKRNFLSTVSVPELRRRRFIESGCDHNPWAS